jgi:hypothetical protein
LGLCTRVLTKLHLYFSEVSTISYAFYNIAVFSIIYLTILEKKEKRIGNPLLANRPKAAPMLGGDTGVGGRGGPQLGRDLQCDSVHRPARWRTWGSTGEVGQQGWRRIHRQRGCSSGGKGPRRSAWRALATGKAHSQWRWCNGDSVEQA